MGARTLFATHYHELNELAEIHPRIKNLKVDVREYGDKVVFLHTVTSGTADHSYGIQVAQMAGLPDEITERAKGILRNLEASDLTVNPLQNQAGQEKTKGRIVGSDIQLTLFDMNDHVLRTELRSLDVNAMTPLEALQVLARLQEMAKS